MRAIRKKRNGFAALFVFCALLTVVLYSLHIPGWAAVLGGVSLVLLLLAYRQQSRFRDAKLICENRILAIPAAVIVKDGAAEEAITEETIVSTFGVLVGEELFKWGCDGVAGSRLGLIEIDPLTISMTFGNEAKKMRVELRHGLSDGNEVLAVKERLLHETGVSAQVSGW